MTRIALFPGSFDPFTNGHLDVVNRSLSLFDELIVAIGINSAKKRYLPAETMMRIIQEIFKEESKVRVQVYQGLTAEFARSVGATFLVRGLRNAADFEYEQPIAQANRHLNPALETVFLNTSPHLSGISSSIIREILTYGGNADAFIPFRISPPVNNSGSQMQ